jgi:hypothetical protein
MKEEIELRFIDEHIGHGIFVVDGAEIELPAIRLWRVRDSDELWNFEAYFPAADPPWELTFVRRITDAASFHGIVELQRSVRIPQFTATLLRPGTRFLFRAQAPLVEFGCQSLPFEPDDIEIVATLSPAEAIPDRFGMEWFSDDGQIRGRSERVAQLIQTSSGLITLQEESSFDRRRTTFAALDLRSRKPIARLRIAPEARTREIVTLRREYQRDLDSICTILGFLGRQIVGWTHIETLVAGEKPAEYLFDLPETFRVPQVTSTSSIGPLVGAYALPDSAIAEMMIRLQQSTIQSALELAIFYVVAATRGTLETMIINSFTSLECLLNANRKLGRKLPISKRASDLILKLGLQWVDLWPSGVQLEDGLRAAYSVRNEFVHEGAVTDREHAMRQQMRIRALAERAIYSMLGGKLEWLHYLAYRHSSFNDLRAIF